jgi:hypothetical protein
VVSAVFSAPDVQVATRELRQAVDRALQLHAAQQQQQHTMYRRRLQQGQRAGQRCLQCSLHLMWRLQSGPEGVEAGSG